MMKKKEKVEKWAEGAKKLNKNIDKEDKHQEEEIEEERRDEMTGRDGMTASCHACQHANTKRVPTRTAP